MKPLIVIATAVISLFAAGIWIVTIASLINTGLGFRKIKRELRRMQE